MNFLKKLALGAAISAAVGAAGAATAISGNSLQTQINTLYSCADCSGTPPDVLTEQYSPDEIWQITASGGSVNALVFQLAGFAPSHEFGVYDIGNTAKTVQLFSGVVAPSTSVTLKRNPGNIFVAFNESGTLDSETFSGQNFGYYLKADGVTFYSQSALNGGNDHMVAYQGDGDRVLIPGQDVSAVWSSGEFLLAWEDLPGGGDRDFNDLAVLVESVISVPEPGSLALAGLSLAALGLAMRRRRT